MGKRKVLQAFLSSFVVLAMVFLLLYPPTIFLRSLNFLENDIYDLRLRYMYKPLSKNVPIVIVGVDDESLKAEGRWPWSREKLATLAKNLTSLGASVIVFDSIFSEPEENIIEEVVDELKKRSSENYTAAIQELQKLEPEFAYDEKFANSLSSGNCVLGYILEDEDIKENELPPPILQLSTDLSNQLDIPDLKGYVASIPVLQKAAKNGGFLNGSPDADGIYRYAPLLLRQGQNVYPSLALDAVRVYLLLQKPPGLVTASYANTSVLEGISFDNAEIPTNPWGQILIPFRGPPYSFPSISAEDVLKGTVKSDAIVNKLVFIGATASALGDLYPTAISPVFTGVEVQASIALGIIEHYFPYKPAWEKGATIASVLIVGLIAAIIFPYLTAIKVSIVYFALLFAFLLVNYALWALNGIVLPIVPPILTLSFLFVFDVLIGYFLETRQEQKIRTIFNQYLPPERIEQILDTSGNEVSLEGESKEMTVLFTDIRNFTNLSEKMSAKELKQFLSLVFTTLTSIIFQHKGTIDKYVGDMVMAFWGAPLEDPMHSKNGATTAYEIQMCLENLNKELTRQNLPMIRLGVGVTTGIVNVGDMGSKYRLSYTVLGDSVNLASRLESLTKYYHVNIIVGEKTQESTKNDFLYRKLDRVRVKGKVSAQYIYELICPNDKATTDLITNVQSHEKALEAYQRGEFNEAKKSFLELQAIDKPYALLYQIYIDRIDKYLVTPPEKDWEGIYNFETK